MSPPRVLQRRPQTTPHDGRHKFNTHALTLTFAWWRASPPSDQEVAERECHHPSANWQYPEPAVAQSVSSGEQGATPAAAGQHLCASMFR